MVQLAVHRVYAFCFLPPGWFGNIALSTGLSSARQENSTSLG
uniref:Uncharacterized protein n=1 Tax=Anguilla anguilla TaxID=7936 RepID=A0A0E9UWW4_ANGAN